MAEFVLASRQNDGQKTKDVSGDFTDKEEKISLKKLFEKFSSKSNNYYISQEEDPFQNLLKASESKSSNKVKEAILDLRRTSDNASVDDPQDTDGCTPLMLSTKKGLVDNINRLVDAGANVNAYNNKRKTPIIIAAMNNKYLAVKTLLGHNADITLTDCNGDTALTHNQNQTQKFKSQKEKQSQKANQGIEDQLYTRLAYNQVKDTGSLNDHTRENHCGGGQQVISVDGTESRQANNGVSKTIFPSEWSETKILTAVKSILYSPKELRREPGYDPERFVAEGKFEGLPIRVVMAKEDSKSNVITAFPIRNQ